MNISRAISILCLLQVVWLIGNPTSSVRAAEVEYKFEGVVSFVDPNIPPEYFSLGEAVSGSFAYDPELLEIQIDNSARHFLEDQTKNRYDAEKNILYLSEVFE